MQVQQVPIQFVHTAWPKVEGFIAAALEHCRGEYTIDQAKVRVSDGRWVLYVFTDADNQIQGCMTVEFYNIPNDRVAFITSLGGTMLASEEHWQQLYHLVQLQGATKIEGAVRPSVARLWKRYGATRKYEVLEIRI